MGQPGASAAAREPDHPTPRYEPGAARSMNFPTEVVRESPGSFDSVSSPPLPPTTLRCHEPPPNALARRLCASVRTTPGAPAPPTRRQEPQESPASFDSAQDRLHRAVAPARVYRLWGGSSPPPAKLVLGKPQNDGRILQTAQISFSETAPARPRKARARHVRFPRGSVPSRSARGLRISRRAPWR